MEEWGTAFRRIQWWLGGIAGLLFVLVCGMGFVGYLAWNQSSLSDRPVSVPSNPAMATRLRDALEGSYDENLESVDVWETAFTYDKTQGVVEQRPFAVSYRLKGARPTITGVVDDIAGLGESGLDPTLADLTYQMKDDEVVALLNAWAARSELPVGYIYPYAKQFDYYDVSDVADEIRVFGEDHLVANLWVVTEGWAPKRGSLTAWSEVPVLTCMVFERDPKTGALTYVGTENAPLGVEEAVTGSYGEGD